MDVVMLLNNYRMNQARVAHLKTLLEIEKAEIINKSPDRYITTDNGERVRLPHAKEMSDPTAVAVEKRDTMEIQYQRAILEAESNIRFVDAWLVGLTARERWIIQKQMIDRKPWREIIEEYREEFGIELTKDALKHLKSKALDKIMRITQ